MDCILPRILALEGSRHFLKNSYTRFTPGASDDGGKSLLKRLRTAVSFGHKLAAACIRIAGAALAVAGAEATHRFNTPASATMAASSRRLSKLGTSQQIVLW